MPCQTQTSQQPQQPTTVLPQNLPQTQADWQRFLQRMNELLGSINNAQYATGVNAVPTEYAVYDSTALPSLRITGATSAFDTSHVQFGAGSLQLTATASTVTVELAASGYPITLHPNWKWIASLFLLTSASTIAGKLSVVTPAKQYDVDISGSPGASWSRLYGDYDLTADASTSCTLLLTLTGVTIGQVFNIEGWMLEPSQGAVLPSPFIMTSGPRTWNQVVGSDAVNTNITTAQTTANTANTTANNAQPAAIVNPGFDQGMYGWTPESDAANWYPETGTNGPDAGTTTYMVHRGSSTTTFLRNSFRAPVVPGQIIKATCKVKGISSPTGTPAIRILFQDINNTDIAGSPVTSGTVGNGVQQLSVVAAAPANAAYATISPGVGYGTGGYYNFDDMAWTYQPSSVDEVPDGATYVRSVQQSAGASAVEVVNATFQLPYDPGNLIVGWTASGGALAYINSTSPSPAVGNQYLAIKAPGGGAGFVTSNRRYAVNVGDNISVGGLLAALNGQNCAIIANFYSASGTSTGAVKAWSTSASFTPVVQSGVVPSGTSYMTLSIYNSTANDYLACNYVWCTVNDIRVAGSGARIGDQRNLPAITFSNYGSGWNGMSLSYTSTTTSATVTASAATLQAGSVAISYHAASTTVSGSAGTSETYYLYYTDPTHSGGVQTLHASTSIITALANDGNVYVASMSVTFPSSGTGGGSGSGGCPLRTAWVIRRGRHGRPQHVRAGKVRVGDWLLRSDGQWAEVTFSRPELQPCVRLVADGFGTLGCSVSAPLQLRTGHVLARDALDCEIVASACGELRHAIVTDLRGLGDQWVQHITLANAPDDFFWTGDAKDVLFAHHNMKPP